MQPTHNAAAMERFYCRAHDLWRASWRADGVHTGVHVRACMCVRVCVGVYHHRHHQMLKCVHAGQPFLPTVARAEQVHGGGQARVQLVWWGRAGAGAHGACGCVPPCARAAHMVPSASCVARRHCLCHCRVREEGSGAFPHTRTPARKHTRTHHRASSRRWSPTRSWCSSGSSRRGARAACQRSVLTV